MNPTQTTAIALFALFAFGTSLPAVDAQENGPFILQVVNDVFDDVDMDNVTLQGACGGGAFESGGAFEMLPSGDGFRFYEVAESFIGLTDDVGSADETPQGYFATGCGRASYPVQVPAGIDHFHVRFYATRTIDEAQEVSSDEPGVEAEQSLIIRDASGLETAIRHYFQPFERSSDEVYVDPAWFTSASASNATVEWYFEDRAHVSQTFPDAYSGIDYQATVRSPSIEYSYLPADDSSIIESSVQVGADVVVQSVVTSTLSSGTMDTFDRINVRVQAQGNPELVRVILPDGTEIDRTVTRAEAGPDGYDPDQVLVERFQGTSWFTIPYGIVAQQGAGDYTFVIQESQGLVVSGGLIPAAAFITLLPLVASAFAIHGTVRFRREAFGGFQRAATWLAVAIGVLLAYYIMVMVSAIVTGTITRMVITPFDAAAWLLYAQVSIAAIGFIVVFVVGRELYHITVPRKTP